MSAKNNIYKILIEEIQLKDVNQDLNSKTLEFESHDDVLKIMQGLAQSGKFTNPNDAIQLALGIKLFGEVMLKNRKDPLFEELLPAFTNFMKKLKSKD